MVEVESKIEEELNEEEIKKRDSLIKQKQREFERKQAEEKILELEVQKKKTFFRDYMNWLVIILALITFGFLFYLFDLI